MKKIILLVSILAFVSCKQTNENMTNEELVALDTIDIKLEEPIVKLDEKKINELKSLFKTKKDEFSEDGLTWHTPKTAATYRNENGLYCYFASNDKIAYNFRFVLQFLDDDWLFIDKCIFLVDGKTYNYIPMEVKRDNADGKIWEWFDENIKSYNLPLIEALANAKSAKIKLIGKDYYDTRTVTKKQILGIKNTLEYYKAKGGTFD